MQFGDGRPDKIDALTSEVMQLKTTTYIRCFIDMSLYNNFNEETKADVLWKKIGVMQKIVRLRNQDGSNMAAHLNAFQKR